MAGPTSDIPSPAPGSPRVRRAAELTWTEVRDLDREATVVVLPTGALEAHGPHLPLSTDVIIAEGMAEAGAVRLEASGVPCLILPALVYTPAPFASGFPGTVECRPEILTELILEIGRSLAGQGFRRVAIANAHLDPAHLGALHRACDGLVALGLEVAFPDLTRRPWGSRLTDEFKSGACHAGRYEGSVVLARRPEWVREELRRGLPPNPVSLSAAIGRGQDTFEEAGGPDAYFGDPAAATAEEGRRTLEVLGDILADAVTGGADG